MKSSKELERSITEDQVEEDQYYKDIDGIVGKKIIYYGMEVEVNCVFKYVKYDHYMNGYRIDNKTTDVLNELIPKGMKKLDKGECNYPGYKAIYIVNVLGKDEEDEDKYMYADTYAIKHSLELEGFII